MSAGAAIDTPLDLDALRRLIAAAPAQGQAYLPVTRRWMEAVERELFQGRVARAQLSRQQGMGSIIECIGRRAP